jgi:hypothetical protein
MGMSSQAYRFQKPDAHIRHSAARNDAKSKNTPCAVSILQTACYPISGYHDITCAMFSHSELFQRLSYYLRLEALMLAQDFRLRSILKLEERRDRSGRSENVRSPGRTGSHRGPGKSTRMTRNGRRTSALLGLQFVGAASSDPACQLGVHYRDQT